jgi:hypothetical protein
MTSPLRRAGVVAAAVVAAEAVFLLVHNAAGVDLEANGTAIGAAAAGVTAAVAGLLGWALLAILERTTARGRRAWTVVAAVVLLLSLAGPLGATGAAAIAGLTLLHLSVGAVLIAGLPR